LTVYAKTSIQGVFGFPKGMNVCQEQFIPFLLWIEETDIIHFNKNGGLGIVCLPGNMYFDGRFTEIQSHRTGLQ